MFDTIIRGGTIVDGLGGERFTADIGIRDGKIAEVGKVSGPAREEFDADGAMVTPGFIDVHTHYDGQFLWDDKMDPSFSHGLTTLIAGNCGVGFAPATKEYRRELMDLMEGVEDIPGIVMDEGLDWSWTSFGDYMGRLSERHFAMDVASHITHAPLRVFAKGAVGSVMGADQLGSSLRADEHALYEEIARKSGRRLTYSIAELDSDPEDIRQMVGATNRANANGLSLHPQIAARGIGGFNMLDAYHAFVMRPSYREVAHLPLAERVKVMRERARRAAILGETDVEGEFANEPLVLPMLRRLIANVGKTFILESDVAFEPGPERRVGALAAAAGKTPEEYMYDHYTQGDGRDYNVSLVLNYAHCNLDHVYDLLQNSNVISGLGDGGAHVKSVCDSSMTTYQLAYWTRDRKRGPRLTLEHMVRKLTSDPARLYGFDDRGVIAVGKRADINVFDYQRLTIQRPYVANDLPSGAGRILQGSEGYLATMVAGEITRRNDVDTGARPGRLARPN